MIVYQITQFDTQRRSVRHWARSKTDVDKIKAKVRAKYRANGNPQDFDGWGGPHKLEIHKGKDGIVQFLNLHASHGSD